MGLGLYIARNLRCAGAVMTVTELDQKTMLLEIVGVLLSRFGGSVTITASELDDWRAKNEDLFIDPSERGRVLIMLTRTQ